VLRKLLGISGSERKSAGQPLSDPALFTLFGGVPVAAGVPVTPASAMRCPTVYAAVKVLAESVAQLPLHLYRRTVNGGKERATDHPLAELLHDAPNDWTTAAEFRLDMQTSLLLHGNAFAYIGRSGGQISELVQIPSHAVTVLTDPLTMEPTYRLTGADGAVRDLAREEVFHLRTVGIEPNIGLSPIIQARDAIGLAIAMEQHASRLFAQGARPSGVFKYAKTLGAEALKRLRDSFNAAHAGGENSGKTMILEDGMEFEPIQFTAVDMQFLELRRHQVAEIARVFRVPLHLLQELERATHHNAESMGRQFLSLTLLPWLKMWEGGIKRALLTSEERATHYAEFLTDDLARADLAARFQAYAQAVTNGLMSPNEVRAAENRPPYRGGDQFRLPLNTEDAGGTDGTA
jgi:HK97 family phage portal protein